MLLGTAAAQELSFSSPTHSFSGTEGATASGGQNGESGPIASVAGGGGSAPGGGGKGGTGLPFTGLEVGVVAAVGAALSATGAAMRRVARRRRP